MEVTAMRGIFRRSVALLAFVAAIASPGASAQPAELVDVRLLPRLEGASVDPARTAADRLYYMVAGTVPNTMAAALRMLSADGWTAYVAPLEEVSRFSLFLKKGPQKLSIFFNTDGSNTNRSGVTYSANWLNSNIPFPAGASDVVFDDYRPYLSAVAPAPVETLLAFFRAERASAGWSAWSPADVARWPNARIDETVENGVRAYFTRDRRDRQGSIQDPIQVTLQRRPDGRTDVEIRVPPFARQQDLAAGEDQYGLPRPERVKQAGATDGQVRRVLTALVPAELDAVLAFYRRELAKRDWKEETRGAVVTPGEVVLNFTSADSTAVLKLGYRYDLTVVSLVQQLPDAVVAARAKARKDAEDALRKRAEEWLRGPVQPLQAMATPTNAPLPVPDTADHPSFDSAKGDLKFDSASSVREIAAFYRSALKPLGFRELPTPIDNDTIAALDFMRNGKRLYISITQLGERTSVRSYGPALVAFASEPRAPQSANAAQARPALEELEADDAEGLPVPKKHTAVERGKSPAYSELGATVTASLDSTLAFYRRALAGLGWKEEAKGAVIKPQQVALSFKTPEGPGTLKLERDGEATSVRLTQRMPEQAAKLGFIAPPGKGRIVLGNVLETEAVVTINRQTVTVPPRAGEQAGTGPKLDLPPGKYKLSVKISGKPAFGEEVSVVLGQTTGLLLGPGGVLPVQVY
jgi:hypothetical protein